MEAVFCVDCLEDALHTYGKPEIFNSDKAHSSLAKPLPAY
jgi:hypothetical protein